MQKPKLIKIYLPLTKNDNKRTAKRIFNGLRNQYLEVVFSKVRVRKIYRYKIDNVEAFDKHFKNPTRDKYGFTLTLIHDKF